VESLTINVAEETGGSFVVSLPLYTPPPRYDKVPWSSVKVEEGSTNAGPWTALATEPLEQDDIDPPVEPDPEQARTQAIELSTLDTDPARPSARGITIIGATLESGWYRVTWLDSDGGERPVAPYSAGEDHLPPAPALEEIAALMRAHVADPDDNYLRTFDEETNPPADQVRVIVETVRQEVATRLRAVIPTRYLDSARYVVAIGTVAYIESSARPEVDKTTSAVRPVYLGRLSDLQEACNEAYMHRLA
jgi:hypothetical protein